MTHRGASNNMPQSARARIPGVAAAGRRLRDSSESAPVRKGTKQIFDGIVLTGRLRTETTRSDLANACYVLEATLVKP